MPWSSRNTHKIKEEERDFGSEVKFLTRTATMVSATIIFKTDGSKNVINIARWLLNFIGLVFLLRKGHANQKLLHVECLMSLV